MAFNGIMGFDENNEMQFVGIENGGIKTNTTVTPTDFGLEVAQGKIGDVDDYLAFYKFGRNPTIGTSEEEVVWDGGDGYYWMPSATILSIVSTSANDTDQGSGAWNIHLYGLDENFNLQDEIITLNGLGVASTTKSYRRVYRAFVLDGGNAIGAIGTIKVYSGVIGNLVLQINPSNNQTQMCVFTVPAGYTAYISDVTATVGKGKDCIIRFKQRSCSTDNCVFRTIAIRDVYQNTFSISYKNPRKIEEKIDIVVTAIGDAVVPVSASFEFTLIKNA